MQAFHLSPDDVQQLSSMLLAKIRNAELGQGSCLKLLAKVNVYTS